jgi:hypothetical protein
VGPDASGAPDSAWAIGTTPENGGYQILVWDGSKFIPDRSGVGAKEIAVGPDDRPWIVNSNDQVFERIGNSWGRPLPGSDGTTPAAVTWVAVGPDDPGASGSVWAIGTTPAKGGFQILVWDGRKFIPDQSGVGAEKIAVGPNGTPWIVNNSHQLFKRNGSSWVGPLPGSGGTPASVTYVAVGPDNNSVWAISTAPDPGSNGSWDLSYQILKWNGAQFTVVPGAAVEIAVGPGDTPWIVNGVNRALHYSR